MHKILFPTEKAILKTQIDMKTVTMTVISQKRIEVRKEMLREQEPKRFKGLLKLMLQMQEHWIKLSVMQPTHLNLWLLLDLFKLNQLTIAKLCA